MSSCTRTGPVNASHCTMQHTFCFKFTQLALLAVLAATQHWQSGQQAAACASHMTVDGCKPDLEL